MQVKNHTPFLHITSHRVGKRWSAANADHQKVKHLFTDYPRCDGETEILAATANTRRYEDLSNGQGSMETDEKIVENNAIPEKWPADHIVRIRSSHPTEPAANNNVGNDIERRNGKWSTTANRRRARRQRRVNDVRHTHGNVLRAIRQRRKRRDARKMTTRRNFIWKPERRLAGRPSPSVARDCVVGGATWRQSATPVRASSLSPPPPFVAPSTAPPSDDAPHYRPPVAVRTVTAAAVVFCRWRHLPDAVAAELRRRRLPSCIDGAAIVTPNATPVTLRHAARHPSDGSPAVRPSSPPPPPSGRGMSYSSA